MRCAAGASLLLLVGCNQIFGITSSQPWDAPVDVIADMPHVALTWQIATTSPSGVPAPLSYPPLAAEIAPSVRIAPLDGPFETASYSSDPATPGWIQIPRHYFEDKDALGQPKPWRLEYTLAGVAHEVQWTPTDKLGHLTVPLVGRLDRQTVPTGSGYTVTPSNPPGSFTFPHIITTGLWTDGAIVPPPTTTTVDYDFSAMNARSLSGDKGRPDAAQGDRALLVDFVNDTTGTPATTCLIAVGSAALTSVALSPGTHTIQTVTWNSGTKPLTGDLGDMLAVIDRFTTALGLLHETFNAMRSKLLLGVAASADFPGLTGSSSFLLLPTPVMQTLAQCPYNANPFPSTAQPAMFEDFPYLIHVQLVDSRTVLGVSLNSGLETAVATTPIGGFKLSFPAPLATQMKLATPTRGMLDLAGTADQLAAGTTNGTFTLTFVPETGATLRADFHDVILHRITGGNLTTERIYTVTSPSVRIDGSLLAPGADYVFEIRTYKGHVMAPMGDFAPVDYPYAAGIIYTRTFRTS